jgi:hypothetical protein
MTVESDFNKRLLKRLGIIFPGCIVLKTNANDLPGFPDRIILFENRWASFESKRSPIAGLRMNQDYYIDLLNGMSFARFVNPTTEELFIHELQAAFRSKR